LIVFAVTLIIADSNIKTYMLRFRRMFPKRRVPK
jgi:hypothetical protein